MCTVADTKLFEERLSELQAEEKTLVECLSNSSFDDFEDYEDLIIKNRYKQSRLKLEYVHKYLKVG